MKLLFTELINSESELSLLASKVRQMISANSNILLVGDLAVGKTTFVAYFCKLFDITVVQSPSYSLHQRYSKENIVIDHFDLYRLETEDEVQASGFFDLLNNAADYKFIEWPDRVQISDFPLNNPLYQIVIKIKDEEARQFELFEFIK